MFRAAQANPFDDVVVKATDENLTSENWQLILDVCDQVGSSETGAKDAVACLIKRLAHRNANVQLYTLELANALSKNCGIKIHRELASRSFTEALLRLANDRNTHNQVKAKILERMEEWTEMFSKDPDLGYMEQAYMRLKTTNPGLHAPSKPFKQEITAVDRQKEEEELQMALALSIKDKPSSNHTEHKQRQDSLHNPVSQPSTSQPPQTAQQPRSSGTTAATVSRVRALYDFQPSEPGELAFRKGDVIAVLASVYKDWWKGSLRGQTGIFPLNYVEKLQDPTDEEVQREAQMEAEVFAEIKNVEKLLALLSTSSSDLNVRDNEEITELYHSTTAIRPKLIELIKKYSQKKEDFTQLNENFIKARRDYEALLEDSMSHPSQLPYGRPPPQQQQRPYGGYNSGPPAAQNYGGAPPQQQQHDYYNSGPPQSQDPPGGYGYPPANGPAPFYFNPPGGSDQQHQPMGKPPPQGAHDPNKPMSPVYGSQQQQAPGAPGGPPIRRASSIYSSGGPHSAGGNPQELATSLYDSPSESGRPGAGGYYPPQQGYAQQQQAYSQAPPQQQQPQPSYPPQASPQGPPPSLSPPQPPVQLQSQQQQQPQYNYYDSQQPPQQQQQQQQQPQQQDGYTQGFSQSTQSHYPPQPSDAPPGPPSSPPMPAALRPSYKPYTPPIGASGGGPGRPRGGEEDVSDFYR